MARPLERPSPVSLLEDAAHLLRRAPLDTLLCHWIGSVPFAVTLLVFWNNVTHPPLSDLACAAQSLAVALLYLWMNCWRAVFAGRLHRDLSGAADGPWNPARISRLVANQAFVAATKPIALPLSFLALVPFTGTLGFYRNVAVLADRDDLDPLDVIGQARRLERGGMLPSWILQLLLLLLWLVAIVNVAIAFILLPQLVRMLTGYESTFSRLGPGFFENRLFFLCVLSASWLLFDPFVQAVYCLRAFQQQSVETGEDLRAGLRRIRQTVAKNVAAAAVLLCAIMPIALRAADSVSPPDLERAVRQTVQSPDYNWRFPPPAAGSFKTSWIIAATDRVIAAINSAVEWAFKMIDRLLRWIFGGLGLSPMPLGGQAPAGALHWSVWALIAVAVALLGWLLWRAVRQGRKKSTAPRPSSAAVRLDDEGLTADRLPEDGWIEMAERCLRERNLRLALRAFYLANLAWLGREKFLTIDAGKTNREFELELRRRARHAQEARELFSANVRAFERAWYGLHEVGEEDAREVRRRAEEMKTRLSAGAAA